jgi:hypothetical protein
MSPRVFSHKPTPSPKHQLLRFAAAVVACCLAGVVVGAMTGFAGRQLYVIGLWELCGAWMLSFVCVTTCHLLTLRHRGLLLACAIVAAIAWLLGFHAADAWSFRREQIVLVAARGLLLADQAVLRDTADPRQLVDLSLLGETGLSGLRGAARVLLQRGLTVHRALGVSHIVKLSVEIHAAFYGLQAAVVALILGRSAMTLAEQPVCARCATWLRREQLGFARPEIADHARDAWLLGERVQPPVTVKAASADDMALTRDSCPRGCSGEPGMSILRRASVGLSARKPGIFATISPQLAPSDPTESRSLVTRD